MGLLATFTTLADEMLNATFDEFNAPVEIFSFTTFDDGQGGETSRLTSFASVDAFIFPMTGTEKIQSGRLITDQLFKCHLKTISGLSTEMKLVYDSEDYQIRSIEDIAQASIWTKLTIEKGVRQ